MALNCLREAGVGGSNPLTPTNEFNDLSLVDRFFSPKYELNNTTMPIIGPSWAAFGVFGLQQNREAQIQLGTRGRRLKKQSVKTRFAKKTGRHSK